MDRYIVNNNVSGQATLQASAGVKNMVPATTSSVTNTVITNEPQATYIIHQGTSKMMETSSFKLEGDDQGDIGDLDPSAQFTAKQIVETQFEDNVNSATYIIDNNSSNSIDSVRIGNHSFVPVVDSPLYNISVAGGTTQYTIEGVVNSGLGNYIIEAPAYIVETKPVGTHTMYIQQPEEPTQTIQAEIVDPKKDKAKKVTEKKKKEPEIGPFYCNVCSAEFHSSASLRFHSYHHNPKSKRFSCIGCEKAFEKDKEKEEHELSCDINYTNNKFKCIFCDLPFSTPKALRNHENKHRPVKKTKKYKHMCICIKCNKAFDAINTLKMHIKKIHGGNAGSDKKKKKKKQEEESASLVDDVVDIKFEPFE
ncbi:hypothetical protein RUM44_001867 [Polyplax serrata]|uniref:C2H2-type domain-containing protein n=1 Tax=Polyplax serrata TaxID=468196 RepID=A0ABR1AL98_POLSC